ncbi:carbohydrate binding domain-containing protein [uncultured Maribacter sp.]|uniref:carbohydrate binding domain-containing protein n=1 Tax=uncultured Maribacter sp. TaxID=431308 RepID=UPI002615D071|nr:carbohydrate binding domain-containing protein [uncultured Maribacter sp.]
MKNYINNKFSKYLFAISIPLGIALSCTPESNIRDGIKEITFKPTASTTLITEGETIKYQDSSLNVSKRIWTFEGGSTETSDEKIIEITYDDASEINDGIPVGYLTTLEVTHEDGSITKNSFKVDVYNHVKPEFSADKNAALMGSEISFTNLSEYAESKWEDAQEKDVYFWSFPGGIPETSNEENPKVTYPNTGDYPVALAIFRSAPEDKAVIVKENFIKIVDVQVIGATSNRMAELGSKIALTYETALQATDASKFSVLVDGTAVNISAVNIKSGDDTTYEIVLETPIVDNQVVSLSYEGGDFASTGELLGPIVDLGIENNVINLLKDKNPGFESDGPGGFPGAGWGNWDGTANNPEVYAVIDSDKHSGNNSLQITMDGTGTGWILNTTGHEVVEEGIYRLTVWAKASVDGIPLDFRSVTPNWSNVHTANETLTTEWAEYTLEFSTVGDENLNRNYWHVLRPNEASNGVQVFLDDISLYRID